jgi:hypothetical protein
VVWWVKLAFVPDKSIEEGSPISITGGYVKSELLQHLLLVGILWTIAIWRYASIRVPTACMALWSVLYVTAEYCQGAVIGPEWFRYFASDFAGPGDFICIPLVTGLLAKQPRKWVLQILALYVSVVLYSEFIEYYGLSNKDGQPYQDLLAFYDMACVIAGALLCAVFTIRYVPASKDCITAD